MQGVADTDKSHLYHGFYRDIVVNIKEDPDKRDRIQIRILGVHSQIDADSDKGDGIKDDDLPWAEQAGPIFGGFSNDNDNKSGKSSLPSVGSWLWCFFDNGNFMRPVYFASVQAKDDFTDIDSDEPDEITTQLTKSGHKFTINDKADEEKYQIVTQGENTLLLDDTKDNAKIELLAKSESKITIDDKSNSENITILEATNTNSIVMDSSGIEIEDTNNNILTMDSDGNNLEDLPGNKIATTASNIEINAVGTIKLVNAVSGLQTEMENLYDIIDGLMTEVSSLTTAGSPVFHTTSPASAAKIAVKQVELAAKKLALQLVFKDS